MKKYIALIMSVLMIFCMTACGKADTTETDVDIPIEATDNDTTGENQDPKSIRKSEIEKEIRNRINEGDYSGAKLDRITINENLGTEEPDDYIALVYFTFERKNTHETANEMMKMYSDNLVATIAKKGIQDISEAAVFWEDNYNNRNLKHAYEYRNGGFYVTDVMGE